MAQCYPSDNKGFQISRVGTGESCVLQKALYLLTHPLLYNSLDITRVQCYHSACLLARNISTVPSRGKQM